MSNNFDTIVLAGGALKGIATLGALQYAQDNQYISDVIVYAGTSSGAIICFLLAIGYTPIEIIVSMCTKQTLEKIDLFGKTDFTNIKSLVDGGSVCTYSHIQQFLETMCTDKNINASITFEELITLRKKKLICSTYNFTQKKNMYLSCDTTPDLECLLGVRMSCNIPVIFESVVYKGDKYIDGGVSDNFPINIVDIPGYRILGIYHKLDINSDTNISSSDNLSPTDAALAIYKLLMIPLDELVKFKIKSLSDRCVLVQLETPTVNMMNFGLNKAEQLDMFSRGYQKSRSTLASDP